VSEKRRDERGHFEDLTDGGMVVFIVIRVHVWVFEKRAEGSRGNAPKLNLIGMINGRRTRRIRDNSVEFHELDQIYLNCQYF
jgi:hypothetical protein